MGKIIKRIVATSFWDDPKVVDKFTPEDRYFMLYLMTNAHTTQAGIYRLPYKVAAFELGYSTEATRALIERFEERHKVICYSKETQEIALMNSLKYSVIKGGKPVLDCIRADLAEVQSDDLIFKVINHLNSWWKASTRTVDHEIRNLFIFEFQRRKEAKEINNDNDIHNDNDNDSNVATNRGTIRATASTDAVKSTIINDEFKKLWSAYPNKKGKKDASRHYKAWRKEAKTHTFEYMKARLDAYNNYCANGPSWYHPMNGGTWFNGRFDDELETEKLETKRIEGTGMSPEELLEKQRKAGFVTNNEETPF
ncbi:hypothetical protein [Lactobacillus sp. ESL0228]|uniref:hypothetical protein n=1 Tax=Lactobacillus sp. ESL0228 TaxID=2069352 RepID=UPI000EFBDDDF|nr:hypothetical protein [Lactobacillus sp. ESL0228]RMC48925.1 hypothetical protein F5ESL0228_04855 [Lactobacillus sp. ESL0228]